MAEVGQLIGPLISCGAELYGSRLGLGLISRSKLFLSVSAFQDVREEVQRPVMESVSFFCFFVSCLGGDTTKPMML